jgi:hypothetical protein
VSTTEELLGRNSSGSGLESREYGRRESATTSPQVRVRFPVLPHRLRNSGPGTGSTQPREYN